MIYLHVPEVQRFVMVDVYDKDETEELTRDERRRLAELARSIRDTWMEKE